MMSVPPLIIQGPASRSVNHNSCKMGLGWWWGLAKNDASIIYFLLQFNHLLGCSESGEALLSLEALQKKGIRRYHLNLPAACYQLKEMVTNGLEPQPKSLYINKDDKFFNRLLSKETSNGNTSCRVYYGVAAGEVPFQWETRPGTPKRPAPTDHIPPLTPPPSFLSGRPLRKQPKSPINVAKIAFPKFASWRKKSPIRRASLGLHGRSRLYSSTSSSSSSAGCEEELEHAAGSPTSPFRFGHLRKNYSDPQGCLPMLAVKNVFWQVA